MDTLDKVRGMWLNCRLLFASILMGLRGSWQRFEGIFGAAFNYKFHSHHEISAYDDEFTWDFN